METESRYAQIEKEALALTWSCETFSRYILGKPVQLETDYLPLVRICDRIWENPPYRISSET